MTQEDNNALDELQGILGLGSSKRARQQLEALVKLRKENEYLTRTVLNAESAFDECSECEESLERCKCERKVLREEHARG